MFKGSQQQDAQEFLRCLLSQIHDEMGLQVPLNEEGCGLKSRDHRDSMISCDSDTSGDSHSSQSRLVGSNRNSPVTKKRSTSFTSLPRIKTPGSIHNSPSSQSKLTKYSRIISPASAKGSVESIPNNLTSTGSKVSLDQQAQEGVVEWAEGDVLVVDLVDRKVTVHRNYIKTSPARAEQSCDQESSNQNTPADREITMETIRGGEQAPATPPEPRGATPPGSNPTLLVTPPEGTSQDETEQSSRVSEDTLATPTKEKTPPTSSPPSKDEPPPAKEETSPAKVETLPAKEETSPNSKTPGVWHVKVDFITTWVLIMC